MIVDEVRTAEAAVDATLLEHRDMRLDAALMDQPGEVRRIAVADVS